MYLFIDIVTTSVPGDFRIPDSSLHSWPRLVQLAWLLTDEIACELNASECIIRPDGYTIPDESSRIHGITTAKAMECGIPLLDALSPVSDVIREATLLVAHNMQYTDKILGAEFIRSGIPDPLVSKNKFCTMRSAADFCRLPSRYSYQWPRLQELHCALFREPFNREHDSLADVRACVRCFFEFRRRSVRLSHRATTATNVPLQV